MQREARVIAYILYKIIRIVLLGWESLDSTQHSQGIKVCFFPMSSKSRLLNATSREWSITWVSWRTCRTSTHYTRSWGMGWVLHINTLTKQIPAEFFNISTILQLLTIIINSLMHLEYINIKHKMSPICTSLVFVFSCNSSILLLSKKVAKVS